MFTKKGDRRVRERAPLTSEHQLKEARSKINKRNKQRATSMEARVAKYLRGRRTPQSGATAKYKGDVEIQLINNPGMYLIECKMSAMAVVGDVGIRLQHKWFPKIREEAIAMNAKFGILIIHFLNYKEDYVFLGMDAVHKLLAYEETQFKDHLLAFAAIPAIDLRISKAQKELRSITLMRKFFVESMVNIRGIKGARFIMPDQEYIMIYLTDFRAIMENV